MTRHIMVDIETLGPTADHKILSIGMVAFTSTKIIDKKVIWVDVINQSAKVDMNTLEWWAKQPNFYEQCFCKEGKYRLNRGSALRGFAHWVEDIWETPKHKGGIWAKSVRFDLTILDDALAKCHIPKPWHFRQEQELRTLLLLYPEAKSIPFIGNKHDPLDDAVYQAKQAQFGLNRS